MAVFLSIKMLKLAGLTLLHQQMLLESTPIPLPPSDGSRDYKDYKDGRKNFRCSMKWSIT